MKEVECWHCEYYVWFSLDDENRFAFCDVKKKRIFANNAVCEQFVKSKAVHTKRKIPEYCKNYNNGK